MGIVEVLFIIVAVVSVIAGAFVLIKFRSLKFSLIAGLVSIAIILAMVLFVTNDSDDKGKDVLLQSFAPTVATETAVATADVSAETVSPVTTVSPTNTLTPIATVSPTAAVVTLVPTKSPLQTAAPTTEPPRTTQPVETTNPDIGKNSTIYLTFDDGPSPRTLEVLDELKKYNVKATFFIVNFDDSQIPILRRVIDEGHAIGIHGYSHVYADIYKSEAAFMENVTKLRDKLKDKLGYDTTIIRFPGGSSNSISARYCAGIMSKLVVTVENQGYQYFDWNVDSRDAEGFSSTQIISQLKATTYPSRVANIVLMHDAGDKYETVKSLPEVLKWGTANGYTFSSLNSSSPTAHHSVRN